MSKQKEPAADLKHSTSNNFGKWGWWIIIYTAILMFLANGCQTDGLNLLVDGGMTKKMIYEEAFDFNH